MPQPLGWAERHLAGSNRGVASRSAADELERDRRAQDIKTVGIHLEKKAKLYDRIGKLIA